MIKKFTLSLLALTILMGCENNNSQNVRCSAESTKELVTDIFFNTTNQLLKKEGYPEISKETFKIELLAIITSKHENDLNKYECSAQLFVPIDKASNDGKILEEFVNNPKLNNYTNSLNLEIANGIKSKITYTSQATDDKKEQLVEVSGLDEISVLVMLMQMAKQTQYTSAKANDVKNAQGYSSCSVGSKIIFSCIATNGKQIEVCDAGQNIEYAFGLPESIPDIIVKAPRNTVKAYGDQTGTSYSIDIPNSDTTYSAFWGVDRYSDEHEIEAGVQVYSGGKHLVTVDCAGADIVNNIDTVVMNSSE